MRERRYTVLSEQAIEEFRKMYSETYGEELSFDEAAEQAVQLIRFCKFALKYPMDKLKMESTDEWSLN